MASPDATHKARIISHMNKDHQDSLVRYLEHYAGTSSFAARNAQLEDVSLSGMTISASGVRHVVPYSQPLSSFSELRPRVVAMDEECIKALDRSDITVKRYDPPHGMFVVFASFTCWTLINMTRRSNFLPGSWLYDNLYKYVPRWAWLNYVAQPYVFWIIVVVHALEAIFLLRPKLRKHNVPTAGRLWWTWMASIFFLDGVSTLRRFNKLVEAERVKKERAKH